MFLRQNIPGERKWQPFQLEITCEPFSQGPGIHPYSSLTHSWDCHSSRSTVSCTPHHSALHRRSPIFINFSPVISHEKGSRPEAAQCVKIPRYFHNPFQCRSVSLMWPTSDFYDCSCLGGLSVSHVLKISGFISEESNTKRYLLVYQYKAIHSCVIIGTDSNTQPPIQLFLLWCNSQQCSLA